MFILVLLEQILGVYVPFFCILQQFASSHNYLGVSIVFVSMFVHLVRVGCNLGLGREKRSGGLNRRERERERERERRERERERERELELPTLPYDNHFVDQWSCCGKCIDPRQ